MMRRKTTRRESATKQQILEAAIRLFGNRSFDTVSLRDITTEAEVNLAAVNYHFDSKLNLVREVLNTLASPINQARLNALDDYDKQLNGARPDLEKVVRLLVDPFVRAARNKNSISIYYPRLLMLARTLPGNLIGSFMADQHDHMVIRFVHMFGRALPDIDEEQIFWRYDFAIGAMLNIVGDSYRSYRLKRVSGGRCDTDDADRMIDELVAFISTGMRATTPRLAPGPRAAFPAISRPKRARQAIRSLT